MIDYLKLICDSLGIQLFYNNNKVLVLSTSVKDGVPILRAHKAFENCPKLIAKTIINYYIGDEDKNAEEERIVEYLKDSFDSITFETYTENSYFKEVVKENLNKGKRVGDDPSLVEYDIISLVSKDFYGKEVEYNKEEAINLANSNLLELEVHVKPLDT